MAKGALHFGAATTDRVSLGQPAAMLSLAAFTIIAIVSRTGTLAANKAIFGGPGNGTGVTANIQLRLSGTIGNIELRVMQTTTALSFITNDTPFSAAAFKFIGATYDQAATPKAHIYSGATPSTIAENAYGTQTAGTGNKSADAGTDPFTWGNRQVASAFGDPWPGEIVCGAFFATALSLADIQSWAAIPRKTLATATAVEFGRGGKDGADWIDYAGNTGTITGATQIDGALVSSPEYYDLDNDSGLWLPTPSQMAA